MGKYASLKNNVNLQLNVNRVMSMYRIAKHPPLLSREKKIETSASVIAQYK